MPFIIIESNLICDNEFMILYSINENFLNQSYVDSLFQREDVFKIIEKGIMHATRRVSNKMWYKIYISSIIKALKKINVKVNSSELIELIEKYMIKTKGLVITDKEEYYFDIEGEFYGGTVFIFKKKSD